MSRVTVQWHPGPFNSRLYRGLANNLRDAIKEYERDVKKSISHQGSPGVHSRPGDPPFKQSGDLRRSYKSSVDRRALVAMLSSDDPKAVWLEFGTSRMAPRPHLRYNLWTHRQKYAAILTRPIP